MTKDYYYSIKAPTEGEFKDRGSKFIAYAYPVSSEEDIHIALEEVRSLHPKARHHCYAYQLGILQEPFRANDDGEPSGTAGRPILGQLKSHEVSDALIIVVRYFGGTLLGASGLINAYKTAAHVALEQAQKVEKVLGTIFRLNFTYAEMGHVMNIVKGQKLNIIDKVFETEPYIDILIRRSLIEEDLVQLKAGLLNITTDQITEETEIPFCKITKVRDHV